MLRWYPRGPEVSFASRDAKPLVEEQKDKQIKTEEERENQPDEKKNGENGALIQL